jgi:nitrogen fixation protein FixH
VFSVEFEVPKYLVARRCGVSGWRFPAVNSARFGYASRLCLARPSATYSILRSAFRLPLRTGWIDRGGGTKPFMTKQLDARWNALVVLLALATMLGCQGLSSSSKSSTTNTTNNTKPGLLAVSPASISFGMVKVGNNQNQPATMTNSGGSSLTVSKVTPTGTGFSVSGLSLPMTLAAGQSQPFTVVFAPEAPGAASGNLAIVNTGSTPTVNVGLTGGTQTAGTLTPNPTSLNFGTIQLGNKLTLSETFTNTGGSSLTVTQVNPTGTGFSVSGLTLPLTLPAGESQPFNITFTPQTSGTVSGNLAIINTGSTSTVNVGLAGGSDSAGFLTPSPASLNFGSVQVGSNQVLSETLTNTGGSGVTVTQVSPTGTGFSVSGLSLPLNLAAGQSQAFNVTYTPTSAGGSSGNLAIISNASNSSLNVALSGNGLAPGSLTPNPSSLNFGGVQVGNKLQLNETLTNSGGVNVNVSQASTAGTGFTMSGLTPPLLLTPGQHYTFTVTFTPPSPGNYSGSVSIVSDASNPNLSIPLSGTGTPVPQGQLTVSPTTIPFGNVVVGTNAQQTGTLSATGQSVIVSSQNVTGSAFAVSGLTFPVTIPAGQHVQFTVTFTPTGTGAASGNVSFASNASNSPTVETFTGNGTPPPTHSVTLAWTASTSQNITGYNVYRGVKSGGPYSKINSVLDASTLYTDTTVVDGTTYYYVTTAVNSSNEESANSNQATAVIPPP